MQSDTSIIKDIYNVIDNVIEKTNSEITRFGPPDGLTKEERMQIGKKTGKKSTACQW